jgi:hypothetical protein
MRVISPDLFTTARYKCKYISSYHINIRFLIFFKNISKCVKCVLHFPTVFCLHACLAGCLRFSYIKQTSLNPTSSQLSHCILFWAKFHLAIWCRHVKLALLSSWITYSGRRCFPLHSIDEDIFSISNISYDPISKQGGKFYGVFPNDWTIFWRLLKFYYPVYCWDPGEVFFFNYVGTKSCVCDNPLEMFIY